jgi:ElaB/YqjD/DUF883 family membrane-anchored ribosome-binding protein
VTPIDRTPDEIERDIQNRRSQLSDTVNDLQHRLSPSGIARDVGEMIQDQAPKLARSVGRAVGSNPVPLMMVGAGLAWMMLSRGNQDHHDEDPAFRAHGRSNSQADADSHWWQEPAASVVDAAQSLGKRLMDGTEDLSEEARARVAAAREAAYHARDAARRAMQKTGDLTATALSEQPLVMGAVAVALGAAIGAALPHSRVEDQTLGQSSDLLFQKAQAVLKDERAKAVAVLQKARDEAGRVLKETASEAVEAVGKSAATAITDRVTSATAQVAELAREEAQRQGLGAGLTEALTRPKDDA